jgi:hypothetical protein
MRHGWHHERHAESAAGDEPDEAVLTFHEQADGRKVARRPGGKVVLVDMPPPISSSSAT